jgi:ABC-2 type transport system permease protein
VTLIYEYVTEAILLLPALIGYGVAGKLAVSYYVYSAVVFLTLPIMPLVYASILSMVIMRFTNIAKNKDRFKVVGGVIAMFAAIGVNIYIQKLTGSSLTPQELEQILAQGNNSLANIVTGVFFNNRFAVTALINSSVLKGFVNIVIYILIAALSVVLFLNLGESLYFKGVIGLSQTASKRMIYSDRDLSKSVKERSALMAYTIKELKLLIRTPVYFMNCVLLNFLWPVFLMIPFFAQPDEMSQLRELSVYLGTGREGGIFLAVAFAISTFLTATNGITSSAISREGSNIYVCKYLPVGYKTQIMAKVLSGISMGVVAVFMMVISAVIIIRPPFYLILLTVLIGLLGVVFSSFTGILIDLNFPKLVWDNEQKAVKQNFNVVINLLLGIVASCIPVFVVIALKFTLWMAFLSLAVLFGVLDALLYVILSTTGVRLLSKIEEYRVTFFLVTR